MEKELCSGECVVLDGRSNFEVLEGTVEVLGKRFDAGEGHTIERLSTSRSLTLRSLTKSRIRANIGDEKSTPITVAPEWVDYSDGLLKDDSQLLTCMVTGRAGMGKSTLCQYLCNRLSVNRKVYLLCTDIGQPLVGLPGHISLHQIDGPFLNSPSASLHAFPPVLTVFLGFVAPAKGPTELLSAVAACVYKLQKKMDFKAHTVVGGVKAALVINTHGWFEDLGWILTDSIGAMVHCRRLVEIGVGSEMGNMPEPPEDGQLALIIDRVGGMKRPWWCESNYSFIPSYQLKEGSLLVDRDMNRRMRFLRLAAYFNDSLRLSYRPATAERIMTSRGGPNWVAPKRLRIPFHHVVIACPRILRGVSDASIVKHLALEMTGSVVGLAHDPDVEPSGSLITIIEWSPTPVSGVGFVHSVDVPKREFVLYVSGRLRNIQKINKLVRGDNYMLTDSVFGPYSSKKTHLLEVEGQRRVTYL